MLMFAWLLCAAANLLPNGGFEAKDAGEGWRIPQDGYWRFEEGNGVGASRCLVWDAPAACPKTLTSFTIPAEPGCTYRVSGRINVEAVKSGEWSFGLDWSAADGTWLNNSGTTRRTDNHPSVGEGWVRYEGGTPPLPSNAASLRIYVYAKKGASGRVRFDDFAIERSGSRAVEYLMSSAYHDAAVRGTVTFYARIAFNPLKHRQDELVGVFSFRGADGAEKVRRVPLASADLVTCDVATEGLALGRHPVRFALCAGDGTVLGTDALGFTREERPTPRKVYVDEHQFAVVDGRRFFPIGVYTHIMTPEQLDFYARGPFNCVKLSNHGISREALDAFRSRDLRVVVDVRDEIKVVSDDPSEDKSAGRAAVEKTVRAWKDHPAVLAWYNCDEAPLSILPDIRRTTKWIHEIDPDHPTFAVTDKPNQTRAFLSAYDIVGMDPYPVGNLSGMNDIGIASRWPEACREGMFGKCAMWQVAQMFSWKWYANGAPAGEKARLPTKAEFASMCWQAIAGGANGLFGYTFADFWRRLQGEERDRVWKDYCDVLTDVRKMEPALLSDPSPVSLRGVPKDMAFRMWRRNGSDWLLLVNRTGGPVAAQLTAGRRYSALKTALGGTVRLSESGCLSVSLDGLGVALVKLGCDFLK